MKKRIKVFSLLLTVIMLASICLPAIAVESDSKSKERSVEKSTQTNAPATNSIKDQEGILDEASGLYYNIEENNEATITGYAGEPTNVVVPESIDGHNVTAIGARAFESCTSLVSVDLANVTSIGWTAFSECENLTEIDFSLVSSIGARAFLYTSLKSVRLPLITSLEEYSFAYCRELKRLELPAITSISDCALMGCRSLTEIVIAPENQYYSVIEGMLLSKDKETLIAYPSAVGDIILPDISRIGSYAFSNCHALTSIYAPNVTTVGECGLGMCNSLTLVDLPRVTSIDNYAFGYCQALVLVSIPDVTSIGEKVFSEDLMLESVYMPLVESIGNGSFYLCESLRSVDLPNITSISDSTFNSCSSLVEIKLPEVTSIGRSAFNNCSSLAEIKLPKVTSISDYAFRNCESLDAAYFYSDAPEYFGEEVFDECGPLFTIYYVEGTNGWTTPEWNGYTTQPMSTEPSVIGDANGDGTVNTGDAVLVLKAAASMVELTETQAKAADINGDGIVNTGDAVGILKHVAGIE